MDEEEAEKATLYFFVSRSGRRHPPVSLTAFAAAAVANRRIVIFPQIWDSFRYDAAGTTISDDSDRAMREDLYGSNSLV
jgi:hypothetical protein